MGALLGCKRLGLCGSLGGRLFPDGLLVHVELTVRHTLNKEGDLSPDKPTKGKDFLQAQLQKSGSVLGDMWFTAWQEAPPDKYLQSYLAKRKLKKE